LRGEVVVLTDALIVIAKCPETRSVKTRLASAIGEDSAREAATAMLADTLETVADTGVSERVLAFDGDGMPGEWLPSGFRVVRQRGRGLGERLAAAFEDAGRSAFLIGSDTPQITVDLLDGALGHLADPRCVPIGPAEDGGYWGIGRARSGVDLFTDVPMSTDGTYAETLRRIDECGLRPHVLAVLRDVDEISDLRQVAPHCPVHSRTRAFAGLLA
jgi:rSAM/selenodomain-associated transferase 1